MYICGETMKRRKEEGERERRVGECLHSWRKLVSPQLHGTRSECVGYGVKGCEDHLRSWGSFTGMIR